MKTAWLVAAALLFVVAFAGGCGQKASTDQPIDQVRADAEKMSVDQLVDNAKSYKAEIAKVQVQLSDLAEQAKKYLTDPLSDGAKQVATQTANTRDTLAKLQERLQVYIGELTKKGEDVTKLLAE